MAIKKKRDLKDCNICRYALIKDNIYCILRLQDENILKESGIVKQEECQYFRKKLRKETKLKEN